MGSGVTDSGTDKLKIEGFDIALTGFDPKEIAGLELELHKDDVPQDAEPQISRAEELRTVVIRKNRPSASKKAAVAEAMAHRRGAFQPLGSTSR